MSGPARASADRGPRSARQGGVYSLHTRGRRALCLGAVCLAGLLMAACMHTVLSEPAGFSGTPRSPAPASPSPPQLTGDPDRPYLLQTQPPYTVALDAGHGGEDGGAVSPDGVPESGINLQIVRKAEGLLVFLGRSVRLTRTGEEAIYSPEAQTLREKKVSDLKNRVALINALPHAVLLSIHQNSMPQHPAVHGAQVFSNPQEPAAGLAQSIQQALNLTVNTGNEKTAKAIGDSVYLMKHITCPGVLVECGFLSNSHEAQLLRQPEQQKRLAAAIVAGYLNFGNH